MSWSEAEARMHPRIAAALDRDAAKRLAIAGNMAPGMVTRLANELPGKAEPRKVPSIGVDHEQDIAQALEFAGIPFEREVRFHPVRKWRLDFSLCPAENLRLAIERQGGYHGGKGRHSRGSGYEADCEKLTEAQLAGWLVLLVPSSKVSEMKWLERAEFAIGLRRMGAK